MSSILDGRDCVTLAPPSRCPAHRGGIVVDGRPMAGGMANVLIYERIREGKLAKGKSFAGCGGRGL